MEEKLVGYYRRELNFLRESGKEFAQAHPAEARRLGLPNLRSDPHVERLLEGFAFLTARIRAKIEDELPEVTDTLLGVLYPHYTCPIPSMSVVRFEVGAEQAATLSRGPILKAGEALRLSRNGEDQACEFKTAYPTTFWPLEIGSIRLETRLTAEESRGRARAAVVVRLHALGNSRFEALAPHFDRLRFYLAGEDRAPFFLRERLLHDVVRVEVRETGKAGGGRSFEISARKILPVGFGPDEALIPSIPRSLPAYRNLQEYFAFPRKYLFLDLAGLAPLRSWTGGAEAEIRFYLKDLNEADLKLRDDSLRLHCAPIVNLFRKVCVPFRNDGSNIEYPVEPDTNRSLQLDVYSVDSVRSGTEVTYRAFNDFRPGRRDGLEQAFWLTRRRPSLDPEGKRTSVSLAFVDLDLNPAEPDSRTVTVEATCTNLDLPSRLPTGDLTLQRAAAAREVVLIEPMTPCWPPPMGRDAQWRLIAHLALNHLSIGDPDGPEDPGEGTEVLRELLRMHCPSVDFGRVRAEDQAQLDGIRSVTRRPSAAFIDGRSRIGGIEVEIDFDDGQYARGCLLLAEVLEQFLGRYAGINAFTRLVAKSGGREIKRWPPRLGDRAIL